MTTPTPPLRRQLKLGLFLQAVGHHAAAWRLPQVNAENIFDADYYVDLAKKAEAAKFDTIFFADGLALVAPSGEAYAYAPPVHYFEPLTLLSHIAAHTSRIGLISTVSTTYLPPYHLARKFASLDHLSKGRAGWNLVTSGTDVEAANFGLDQQIAHGERYQRAREHIEVVKKLWDSWGDTPRVLDKDTGVFFDPAQVQAINHSGDFFKVKGPLQSARPVQGHPVIVQAGSSEDGQALAAETAEIVFTAQQHID
ncbi:MAG: NtaA/DmoA family FMN-dependent monooxygenase, partial [Asticcacaulis sp.]